MFDPEQGYTPEQVADFRTHPHTLDGSELWAAYGKWVLKLCGIVARRYADVDPCELVGIGFEQLTKSAKHWRPGQARFCGYSKRLIYPKLHQYALSLVLNGRPRPKSNVTKDPCQGVIPLDKQHLDFDGDAWAPDYGNLEVSTVASETSGMNLYSTSPACTLEISWFREEMEARIEELERNPPPEHSALPRRLRAVLIEGRGTTEVAKEEGVSKQAVDQAVRVGRRILQDLIGMKKITVKEAQKLRNTSMPRVYEPPRGKKWREEQVRIMNQHPLE